YTCRSWSATIALRPSTGPPIVKIVPTTAICIHCVDILLPLPVAPPTRLKCSRLLTHVAQRERGRSQTLCFDGAGGGDAELRVVAVQQPELRDQRGLDSPGRKPTHYPPLRD